MAERLVQLGANVNVRRLKAGDYAVAGVIVERKTVPDLHVAIIKGRFWAQIGKLRRANGRPHLLLEGEDHYAGPLRPESIRGAWLALAELGVPVIRSRDTDDSARWLVQVARRAGGRRRTYRPVYAQRPTSRDARTAAEAMLAAVPGISSACARALLAHYGSIEAIVAAGPRR